jgi:hypothetical protein
VTIDFSCSNCSSALKAPDEYAGKMAKCKKCQAKVRIPEGDGVDIELEPDTLVPDPYQKLMSNLRQELKKMKFPDLQRFNLNELPDEDVKAIFEWGMWTFNLGSSEQGTIDEIKYDGHLVILADGSRWEVEDGDAYTVEGWLAGDEIVIVSERMYRLDESESAAVSKE